MARKPAAPDVSPKSAKPKRRPAAPRKPAAKAAPTAPSTAAMNKTQADMSRMANLMTPDQAIELYKANAKMALDVINAAIDNTAKLRKLQFEGEESAREFGRKAARNAAEAKDAQSLMSRAARNRPRGAGEEHGLLARHVRADRRDPEAPVRADRGAGQGMPGVKQAKAAMQMMPDLGPMKNVVDAMQRIVGSGRVPSGRCRS